MIICPYCDEKIDKKSLKCKYCWEIIKKWNKIIKITINKNQFWKTLNIEWKNKIKWEFKINLPEKVIIWDVFTVNDVIFLIDDIIYDDENNILYTKDSNKIKKIFWFIIIFFLYVIIFTILKEMNINTSWMFILLLLSIFLFNKYIDNVNWIDPSISDSHIGWDDLKGLSWWLALLGFWLAISPIIILWSIYNDFIVPAKGVDINIFSLFTFWIIIDILFIISIFFLLFLYFWKSKYFPILYKISLIIDFLILLIFIEPTNWESVKSVIISFFSLVVWWSYIHLSKRVKNTFVENISKKIFLFPIIISLLLIISIFSQISLKYDNEYSTNTILGIDYKQKSPEMLLKNYSIKENKNIYDYLKWKTNEYSSINYNKLDLLDFKFEYPHTWINNEWKRPHVVSTIWWNMDINWNKISMVLLVNDNVDNITNNDLVYNINNNIIEKIEWYRFLDFWIVTIEQQPFIWNFYEIDWWLERSWESFEWYFLMYQTVYNNKILSFQFVWVWKNKDSIKNKFYSNIKLFTLIMNSVIFNDKYWIIEDKNIDESRMLEELIELGELDSYIF